MNSNSNIFKDCISTIKEISIDTSNNESMSCSETEIINFDTVKTKYANELGLSEEVSKSVDGLMFLDGDKQVFIEFKNGTFTPKEIIDKIKDSLLIYCDIIEKNISHTRKTLDFMLVYNMEKKPFSKEEEKKIQENNYIQDIPSRTAIANYYTQKGGEEFIRFGLEKYKGLYFKDVHTYDKKEFDKKIEFIKNKYQK